jgi:hypothetical protein
VLLGIVMIIVTFGASEAAETGVPPAAANLLPFVAPLAPLALALAAALRARQSWARGFDWSRRDQEEKREAILSVVAASVLVLVALELGPIGAVQRVPSPLPRTSAGAGQ